MRFYEEWCYCVAREPKHGRYANPYSFHCKCGYPDGLEADMRGSEDIKPLYHENAITTLIPLFKYQTKSMKDRSLTRQLQQMIYLSQSDLGSDALYSK